MTNVTLRTGTAAQQMPADKTNDLEINVTLPRLLNQRDLANYTGKSTAWFERARWAGTGPRYIKLGHHVRYRAEDVMAWIEQGVQETNGGESL